MHFIQNMVHFRDSKNCNKEKTNKFGELFDKKAIERNSRIRQISTDQLSGCIHTESNFMLIFSQFSFYSGEKKKTSTDNIFRVQEISKKTSIFKHKNLIMITFTYDYNFYLIKKRNKHPSA